MSFYDYPNRNTHVQGSATHSTGFIEAIPEFRPLNPLFHLATTHSSTNAHATFTARSRTPRGRPPRLRVG